jgi:hypothetical protein
MKEKKGLMIVNDRKLLVRVPLEKENFDLGGNPMPSIQYDFEPGTTKGIFDLMENNSNFLIHVEEEFEIYEDLYERYRHGESQKFRSKDLFSAKLIFSNCAFHLYGCSFCFRETVHVDWAERAEFEQEIDLVRENRGTLLGNNIGIL